MSSDEKGKVYLVGAGPGDVGLLTLRGAECLRRADVVIYDNLANPALLRFAPAGAELIYAGKKADQHTKSQDEINALLVERARAGLTVVRLKGGDPFLFGRGGEEAAYLIDNAIPWEVVPGVSSAIAVPAYAGIPVTHRSVNGSLQVVTGHENVEGLGADLDWSVLAQSRGTIVMLMGVKNLGFISRQLVEHGMSPATPVALVQWGTRAQQKTLVSNLDKVVDDVAAHGIRPPAITIIGEVVSLRQTLAWVEQRPLFGVRVAVTRPLGENDELTRRLEELGAEVLHTPTLELVPLEPTGSEQQSLAELSRGGFDWLIFTSGNGVRHFMRVWKQGGYDVRQLGGTRIAVVGDRTAGALEPMGIRPDVIARDSSQEGLAAELAARDCRRVLIARAQEARPVLEDELAKAGKDVGILPVYRMDACASGIAYLEELLESKALEVVTFTSARTFTAWAEAGQSDTRALMDGVAAAAIGPVTAGALKDAGIHPAIVSDRADMGTLADAICRWKNG